MLRPNGTVSQRESPLPLVGVNRDSRNFSSAGYVLRTTLSRESTQMNAKSISSFFIGFQGFVMTLKKIILPVVFMLIVGTVWLTAADQPVSQAQRDEFQKAFAGGNYKVAYEGFRKLALDPKDDPARVGGDLQTAISALQQLGRTDEIDEFREAVIEIAQGKLAVARSGCANIREG